MSPSKNNTKVEGWSCNFSISISVMHDKAFFQPVRLLLGRLFVRRAL
ncbi:Protein of unknown function [Pyronema omphalodes CBS 100304]|uniref:Uncharacterized protein n=1 Tax=Pyronema omphalodes (strain CBS 100304) TaxID=1076935 RepID=U4L283_PYROM|nr:Protein of unknown function [Pyronema omphalodes CBS 100304]